MAPGINNRAVLASRHALAHAEPHTIGMQHAGLRERSQAVSAALTGSARIFHQTMALNATIYRCRLAVSDIGRNYYQTHQLTIARHPSETDERMMVRLLAFALNADISPMNEESPLSANSGQKPSKPISWPTLRLHVLLAR